MNNDEIKAKYSEVNNEIEGIGIFDGNRDKALDDARADALETNEILSMYNRGELFTKEVIEREKELARANERAKFHPTEIGKELLARRKHIEEVERQRCIQTLSQDSFVIEVKNRLKGFAIYETDYRIKMIVREVIYKLSENIDNKHPHKLICECGDVKSMHVGNYAGRCKRILCGCPKFKLSSKSGEEGQDDTAKQILKKVDACWKDMGLGRQGFDWDEYYDIKKEYKVDADKCSFCGHSLELNHKTSWETISCSACLENKGCNKKVD